MKGPRELKRFVAKHRKYLKAVRWDCLTIFKLERCKKWKHKLKHKKLLYDVEE